MTRLSPSGRVRGEAPEPPAKPKPKSTPKAKVTSDVENDEGATENEGE